jgi:hypothetical protein
VLFSLSNVLEIVMHVFHYSRLVVHSRVVASNKEINGDKPGSFACLNTLFYYEKWIRKLSHDCLFFSGVS